MRFGDYPNKRPIEDFPWSEDIPSHWQTIRLGFLIEMLVGNAFSSEKFEFEGGTRLVRGDNVTEGRLRWGDKQRCWPEITKDIEKYLLADGDVLIGMDGSKVGKNFAQIRQEDLPLLLVQRVARLRSSNRLYPSYLRYLIGSPLFLSWVEQRKTDPMVPHITAKDICNYRICCPDYEEQKVIARFLDFKTAQIDTLIAKKKALLDKLAEKRTALISHAVTKGLDPSVPMKDSGVEWLGKIPKGWKRIAVRWLIRIGSGDFISNTDTEFDCSAEASVPVVGGNGVMAYTNQVNAPNDCIVIGRVGAHCGNVHFIKAPSWITDNALRVRIISDDVSAEFLICALKTIGLNDFANKNAQPLITGEMVKSKSIALPPMVDQIEICRHIENIEAHIKSQTEKTELAIDKLREYRAALITNAVTGKIDVRGFQMPSINAEKEVA